MEILEDRKELVWIIIYLNLIFEENKDPEKPRTKCLEFNDTRNLFLLSVQYWASITFVQK